MILKGIFLFLLGTAASATKTKVKYEGPSKITVTEEKDDNVILPGLGAPPYGPSFFHQGSNFYFNPQIVLPGEYTPPDYERTIVTEKENKNITIVTQEVISDIVVEERPAVEMIQVAEGPIVYPEFGSVSMYPSVSNAPILIEELTDEIPPPPELPPVVLSEIQNPAFVREDNKRIILVPAPAIPGLPSYQPQTFSDSGRPVLPVLDCVQNIVLDRVLPNLAYGNGKLIELISIADLKRP